MVSKRSQTVDSVSEQTACQSFFKATILNVFYIRVIVDKEGFQWHGSLKIIVIN